MGRSVQRKRLWVNGAFQGRLLLRTAGCLVLFVAVVGHLGLLYELVPTLGAASSSWKGFGDLYLDFLARQRHLLLALLLVLPALLYDLLRFSHRIAGPLYRCQEVLREMASGRPVPPFVPRKGDHMKEFFEAFNAAIREWNTRLGAGEDGKAGVPVGAAGAERL
jgi:hypothetical protein